MTFDPLEPGDPSHQPPPLTPVQLALQLLQAGIDEADVIDRLVDDGVDRARATTIVQLMASRQQREALTSGQRNMRTGALWFILGAVVTGGTYYFSAPGSSFLMAWGAILFGGMQFLRGWRAAGRPGLAPALRWMLVATVVLAALFAVSTWLPRLHRTYQDPMFRFSIRYPLTWQVEVHDEPAERLVSFSPRWGWGNDPRLLEVRADTSHGRRSWSAGQLRLMLEALAASWEQSSVVRSQPQIIDGRPSAEIAYRVVDDPQDGTLAVWQALSPAPGAIFWLSAFQIGDQVNALEGFYRGSIDSFHYDPPLGALELPTIDLACEEGYESYADPEVGCGVCQPETWVAVRMEEDETSGGPGVSFFAMGPDAAGEFVSIQVSSEPVDARDLTDAEWESATLENLAEEGVALWQDPKVSRSNGLRILRFAWREPLETEDSQYEVSWLIAWILGTDRHWWLEAVGSSHREQVLQATCDRMVAKFEVWGP